MRGRSDPPHEVAHRLSEPAPTLADRLVYVATRALAGLVRALPLDTASGVMGRSWRLVAPFLARHKRALRHMARALPHLSPAERDAVARDMWETLGRVTAEGLSVDKFLAEPDRVFFDRVRHADLIARIREKGCVFVTMHSGNWEIAGFPALREGVEILGVYQRIANAEVDRFFRETRREIYPAGVVPKGPEGSRAVLSHLRAGKAVALVGDHRDVEGGLLADHLGAAAWLSRAPAALCRVMGKPLVAARVVRTGPGARFRVEIEEVPIAVTEDRDADTDAATLALARLFETWIADRPGEYMWINRRWFQGTERRRPKRPPVGPMAEAALAARWPDGLELAPPSGLKRGKRRRHRRP